MSEEQQLNLEVTSNNEPYTFIVSGQTINLRDYVTDEASYQVLKIALTQKDYETEVQHQADIDKLTALKDEQIAEITQQYKSQIDVLQAQYNDVSNKLKAAADENESLKIRVKELEATQEKPKVPTNLDSNALAEAIKKAQEAKPKIYNVRAGDNKTSFYIANLAETDEEIRIPWMDIGRYVQLSDEEAARFRQEREAEKAAAVESVPEAPSDDAGIAVPPAFQEVPEAAEVGGNETASQDVSDVGAGVASEGLAVSREEFEALVKRVEKLEGVQSAA